jgi:hypothetical protein
VLVLLDGFHVAGEVRVNTQFLAAANGNEVMAVEVHLALSCRHRLPLAKLGGEACECDLERENTAVNLVAGLSVETTNLQLLLETQVGLLHFPIPPCGLGSAS